MRRSTTAVASLAAVLAAPAGAGAAERFAVPSGGDSTISAACTSAVPCTLREALLGANAGDVVTAAPGTYEPPPSVREGITLQGTPGAPPPLISGNDEAHGSNADPALRVTGGTVRRVDVTVDQQRPGSVNQVTGIALTGATALAEQVRVTVSRSGGGLATGVQLMGGALLRDSVVKATQSTGGGFDPGVAGAETVGVVGGDFTLVGVTIVSDGDGVSASPCFEPGNGTTTATLVNTIARGGLDTGEVDLRATAPAPCSTIPGDPDETGTIAPSTSSFRADRTAGPIAPGAGNQSSDPLLDTTLGQLAGSPTIDAGVTDARQGAADVDGGPRLAGAAVDIGGDEFGSAAPPAVAGPAPVPTPTGVQPPVTVAPPVVTPPATSKDRVKPVLRKLSLARRSLRRGTTVTLRGTLSEKSTVRVRVERLLKGRKRGKACSRKVRKGKRCTVRSVQKTVRVSRRPGKLTIRFSTKKGRRTLPAGSYRLVVTATGAAGNRSRAATLTLRLTR